MRQEQRTGVDAVTLCLGVSIIIESPTAKLWLALLTGLSGCTIAETRAYRAPVHLPVLPVRLDIGTAVLEVRERFVWFKQSSDHVDVLIRHRSTKGQKRIWVLTHLKACMMPIMAVLLVPI